jgi:hypothetical protein
MDKPIVINIVRASAAGKCYLCGRTREDFAKTFLDDVSNEVQRAVKPDGPPMSYVPEMAFNSFSFTHVTDLRGKTQRRIVIAGAKIKKFFMPTAEIEPLVKITMTIHLCPACNAMYETASAAAYRAMDDDMTTF